MIFITCGTVSFPFKRLVDEIIKIYKNKVEEVIIQTGEYHITSSQSHIIAKPYFSLKQIIQYYKTADLIIAASGEASVHQILYYAKNIPIFVPRQKKYHEHVDNQQELIGEYIKKYNLAATIYDIDKLNQQLKKKLRLNKHRYESFQNNQKLINNLINYTNKFI